MSVSYRTVVRGFAKALPPKIVSNHDLSQMMDTSDEWITKRTGIKTRHWVEAPMTTSDLGVEAARETLSTLGEPAVDAIVAATVSPDYAFPGIGVLLQAKLGLSNIPAYDVRNQCCGFLYGLEMASALVRSGVYRRVLLVGAEVHSTALDLTTRGRDIAVLFGDGAGACLVESISANDSPEIPAFEVLDIELHSDGAFASDLWCQFPGSASFPQWCSKEMVEEGKVFASMNGRVVFEHAVKRMTETSLSVLKRTGLAPEDVKLFVPHQANLRINRMVGMQIGLNKEQVFNTIQKYGNTTAATIPIGMADAVAEVPLKSGDVILNAAFGSGFTWAASVLRAV